MENPEKENVTEIASEENQQIGNATSADENDKLKAGHIVIIILTVLFALIVGVAFILYVVFSLGGDFSKDKSKDIEKINSQESISETKEPFLEISDDPFDFQFKINGVLYGIPVTVKDFQKNGWTFGVAEDAEGVIAEGATEDSCFVLDDGTVLFVTLKNFSQEEITQQDACIVGIKFDKDYIPSECETAFIKNLSLNTSKKKEIEAVFGKCTEVYETNRGTILIYEKDNEKSAKFIFENGTGALKEMEFINTFVPDDYIETVFKQIGKEKYKTPQELGDSPLSGVIEIGGDLYRLPIPVSEFTKNGWEFSCKGNRTSLSGNEYAFITLTKDGVTVPDVEICNFEKTKRKIEKCYVISMSVSSESAFDIILPKNIKTEMSEDDFLIAVSGLDCTINSAEFNQYTFTDNTISLTVDVDKQEEKVKYWILRYDTK